MHTTAASLCFDCYLKVFHDEWTHDYCVECRPFYGYYASDMEYLKIYLLNPSMVRRLSELFQTGQVREWMADGGWRMAWIPVCSTRLHCPSTERTSTPPVLPPDYKYCVLVLSIEYKYLLVQYLSSTVFSLYWVQVLCIYVSCVLKALQCSPRVPPFQLF